MADDTHDTSSSNSDPSAPPAVSFTAFVLSLAHTTAVHLGDVPDPVSGATTAPNLAAAQQMIDILGLLELKTRGNLTAEERRLLDEVLYALRMHYVEVARAGAKPADSRIITPDEPRIIIP